MTVYTGHPAVAKKQLLRLKQCHQVYYPQLTNHGDNCTRTTHQDDEYDDGISN